MDHDDPGLTPKDAQALDAAKLYYSGLPQREVAERLHVSRSTVSKLLAHAEHRGFVRIEVYDPRERDPRLLDALIERFCLLDVRLVSPAGAGPAPLRQALGHEGAALLADLVRDGDRIATIGSRTIAELAGHLPTTAHHDLDVVQMARALIRPDQAAYEDIGVRRFSQALGAHLHALDAPLIVPTVRERNAIHRDPDVRRVLDLARSARIGVLTVGGERGWAQCLRSEQLSDAERRILSARAAGDLASRFIDVEGRICAPDLNNRMVGLSLPELRHLEQRVIIAGGQDKAAALRAALRRGYANRLVTDVATARRLIAIDDERLAA